MVKYCSTHFAKCWRSKNIKFVFWESIKMCKFGVFTPLKILKCDILSQFANLTT